MTNPWTKSNPFLSMALSGANTWASMARSFWFAEAQRMQNEAIRASMQQVQEFWRMAFFPLSKR